MSTSITAQHVKAIVVRGRVAGMVAGAAMAMFAMVASVTYQHHGFFTPLFHISALFGSPDAMMRSAAEAMAGNKLWFSAGPAVLGLLIHMVTGAMFGIGYAFLVMFGLVLGVLAIRTAPANGETAVAVGARSAMLWR